MEKTTKIPVETFTFALRGTVAIKHGLLTIESKAFETAIAEYMNRKRVSEIQIHWNHSEILLLE